MKTKDEIIKSDVFVKSFIKWSYLFEIGLSEDDANTALKNDYYQKIRTSFVDCFNKDDIMNRLIYRNYNFSYALDYCKRLMFKDINIFNQCVEEFNEVKKHKNYTLEYFISRGWTIEESKEKLKQFFLNGPNSIKEKRKNSQAYDDFFKKSRIPGANKSHIINGNNKKSQKENEIFEHLTKSFNVKTNFYSPVKLNELNKIYKKRNFCHDFLIDDTFIVEYNGIYWHKDRDFEIKKAYNCIYNSGRKKELPYIIIWEFAFNSTDEYINYIKECIDKYYQEGKLFFSTDDNDEKMFYDFSRNFIKEQKADKLFKDIVLRFKEESHCCRLKVACIAVKDGRIVATGINGTPPGMLNCDDYFNYYYISNNIATPFDEWRKTDEFLNLHHEWSNIHEIHAEQSMIGYCAAKGISIENATIYSTTQPCIHCTKALVAMNIKKIIYIEEYNRTDPQCEALFINSKIEPYHLKLEE